MVKAARSLYYFGIIERTLAEVRMSAYKCDIALTFSFIGV
jgi:hypothetical protein